MPDLSDLPPPLARLMSKLLDAVASETGKLEAGSVTVPQWQREMERLLVRYHVAAYMTGQDSETISDAARALIVAGVQEQLSYLDKFAATITETLGATGGLWAGSWVPRAAMYAGAIKAPYWRGVTKAFILPHYPGDGSSDCLSWCRCFLQIETISEAKGDYDVYWRMSAAEHCRQCPQRALEWSPYKIRGGRAA